MSTPLERFCATHGLSAPALAGQIPAWKDSVDKYDVVGSGEILGVEVQRYGQLGNNVMQLMQAVVFARRYRLGWVRANGFGALFRQGRYVLEGGVHLLIDVPRETVPDAALAGRFFFWWGTAGALRSLPAAEAVQTVRQLRQILTVSTNVQPSALPTIHVHIRGGREIFGTNGGQAGTSESVHPLYLQPPLAYYLAVLEHWFKLHPAGRVVIVSMDRLNPCVDVLEENLRNDGRDYTWQSGTLEEDLHCLFGATSLVAGYGTFIPAVSLLSELTRHVYFFRDPVHLERLRAAGVETVVVEDRCGQYMARGKWNNTPEERKMMLDYPLDCLAVPLP